MREGIYCCTQEDNNCPKKNTCFRFINPDSNPHTTLFKYACTKDNSYLLYIEFIIPKNDIKNDEESEVNKVSNEG